MANPLTDADLQKFVSASIKAGDQFGQGRGNSPINSGVSYSYPEEYATVRSSGHTTKTGFTSHLVWPTTDNTHKMGYSYGHVCGNHASYYPTSPWSSHSTNEFGSGSLNHIYHHITLPSTYTTQQVNDIIQNLKDIENDSNATLVQVFGSSIKNVHPQRHYFNDFSSRNVAYTSKRKRKRARQII